MVCQCGMSAIERTVFRVLLDGGRPDGLVYHVGQHSRFRNWLSDRLPNLMSSQFEQGRRPGEIGNGVRYEDLTRLSFPSSQFDTIICMEILEHIPDYKAALREMARVLRRGGVR